MDPLFLKVAHKEVNSINKIVARNVEYHLYDIGPKKSCKEVIQENLKEFKGLMKAAAGFDSPNKKIKDILSQQHNQVSLKPSTQSTGSQQNLSMY